MKLSKLCLWKSINFAYWTDGSVPVHHHLCLYVCGISSSSVVLVESPPNTSCAIYRGCILERSFQHRDTVDLCKICIKIKGTIRKQDSLVENIRPKEQWVVILFIRIRLQQHCQSKNIALAYSNTQYKTLPSHKQDFPKVRTIKNSESYKCMIQDLGMEFCGSIDFGTLGDSIQHFFSPKRENSDWALY